MIVTHRAAGLADDWGRYIGISPAEGLLAKDAAGTIIHDIPTAPILIGAQPMGHYYAFDKDDAAYTLIDTSSPTLSAWETGVQAVSRGNQRINGARLKLYLSYSGATASGTYAGRFWLRPTGSGWDIAVTEMTPSCGFTLTIGSALATGSTIVAVLDTAVDQVSFQFDLYPYVLPSGGTPTKRLIVQQLGFWI